MDDAQPDRLPGRLLRRWSWMPLGSLAVASFAVPLVGLRRTRPIARGGLSRS